MFVCRRRKRKRQRGRGGGVKQGKKGVSEKQTSLPSTVEHWEAPPLPDTRPCNWLTGWVEKGSSYLATEVWLVSILAQIAHTYRGEGEGLNIFITSFSGKNLTTSTI